MTLCGIGLADHTRFSASSNGIAGVPSSSPVFLGVFAVDIIDTDQEETDMNVAEEEVLFNNAIGNALAQWAYAEGQIQRIVLQCVPPQSRQAVAAAYVSIESFFAKLRFCDNLVVGSYSKSATHLPRWSAAFRQADKLAVRRNKLVHGVKHPYLENDVPGRRWAIVDQRPVDGQIPHMTGKKPPNGSLCLLDIESLREEFHALTRELCNVFELLGSGREPFPAGHAPANGRPTIRIARNQIRGALGLPLLPVRRKS